MRIPLQVGPIPNAPKIDPSAYLGRYERESMAHEVVLREDELVLITLPSGILATAMGTDSIESRLIPYDRDVFLTSMPSVSGHLPAVFYDAPDGSRYLHFAGRAAVRL